MERDRIIGSFTGEDRGPLLICIGSMHGNEPAGTMAIELVLKMLEVEPITNPSFRFQGKFIGLIGNLEALRLKQRFVAQDLNRMWKPELLNEIKAKPIHERNVEEKELIGLLAEIQAQIEEYKPERVVIMDLHTTAAYGGIFTLVSHDPESLRIGMQLRAPVIKNMMKGIQGTAMQYFNSDNLDVETVSVVFESGQHNERLSVNRAIAAIINCMRTINCVEDTDVETRHNEILIEYSKSLPKLADLLYKHPIQPEDDFAMKPGYKNFQYVEKGEYLANDINGPILSPEEGLILMPLYQIQGEDGFFLIKSLDPEFQIQKQKPAYAYQRTGS